MNQHEQDWLNLGQRLHDFQPVGDPDADFQQLLQQQAQPAATPLATSYRWALLGALGLLLLYVFWRINVGDRLAQDDPAVPPARELLSSAGGANDNDGGTTTAFNANPAPTRTTVKDATGRSQDTPSAAPTVRPTRDQITVGRSDLPALSSFPDGRTTPKSPAAGAFGNNPSPRPQLPAIIDDASQSLPTAALPDAPAAGGITAGKPVVTTKETSDDMIRSARPRLVHPTLAPAWPKGTPRKESGPAPLLKSNGETFESLLSADEVTPAIRKKASTSVVVSAGSVTHWRGASFMEDRDLGLYVHVGVLQQIGQRLGLEFSVGYRGHGFGSSSIATDRSGLWAYNKKQETATDAQGQEHTYTYEGWVDSYRALEFNLLANYRVTNRFSVHGGASYALPTFEFRELLHGPEFGQPFSVSSDPSAYVSKYDFGLIIGGDYFLSENFAVRTSLTFGQVDLIDNAAEDRMRKNHSSSLNVGVRYLLR